MTFAVRNTFVDVQGTEIFYAEAGAGPPLVLLHGISDTHRTWRKILPALATRHRVLMPDLPGCGLSGRPNESYSLAWQAKVIGNWLAQLKLEDVDLVGHSYGGGVAQFVLLSERARVRRLALIASGGLGREVSIELRLAAATRLLETCGQPFMSAGTSLALRAVGALLDPEEAEWMSEANRTPGTARAFARTVRDVIDWRGQRRHFLDHAEEVASLPPMALFWGEKDRVIPFRHAFESTKCLLHVDVTLFPEVGHCPQHQVPEALSRALLDFFEAPFVLPARLVRSPAPRASRRSRLAAALGAVSAAW